MWKQVALLVVLVAMILPSGSADGDAGGNTHDTINCTPVSQGELLPYGTKFSSVFLSPSLHTFRLAYHIPESFLKKGHAYELYARNPINGLMPDFDVVFELKGGGNVLHNAFGDESGTVPNTAVRAYVFMPVGPDTHVAPGNPTGTAGAGAFTFEHC